MDGILPVDLLDILPVDLFDKGIDLSPIGYEGRGFYAKDLVCVADILIEHNMVVVGGEAHHFEGDRLVMSNHMDEFWDFQWDHNAVYEEYVARSVKYMLEYVEKTKHKKNYIYAAIVADRARFYIASNYAAVINRWSNREWVGQDFI
ncbi:hypothetical protein RsTz2092_13070 [Deferribacterales bacterium RsTz2092]|nr:hypothetical protein AGMMS49941_13080 [Deferribacterales bacterium]